MKKEQKAITEVLDEIRSVTIEASWEIDRDRLLGFLPISLEDYYRFAYSTRNSSSPVHIRDRYGPDAISEIIEILEFAGLTGAGEAFYRAGYYFPEQKLIQWNEFFLSVSMSKMQSHFIDPEFLRLSLSACRNPDDGLDFYAQDQMSMDRLMEFAIPLFLEAETIEDHHLSRSILRTFIEQQIKRRLLIPEDLYAAFFRRLRAFAKKEGFLAEETFESGAPISGKQWEALCILGFNEKRLPERKALKKRYRELMKKNHPDINPEGSDRTRQINQAYSFLIGEIELYEKRGI